MAWRLTDEEKEALLRKVMASPYRWHVVVKEGLEAGADAQALKLGGWLFLRGHPEQIAGKLSFVIPWATWEQLQKEVGLDAEREH